MEQLCYCFRYEVDHGEDCVFGFDAEWPVHNPIGGSGKTGVIQICQHEKVCHIFHVYNLFKLPAILVDILQHSKVKLVGLNINGDIWKLGRDFGIKASQIVEHNCIELAVLAKNILKTTQVWSLESLIKHLLKKGINKSDELRKSDWSEFLSDAQQLYAATDAFVYVLNAGLKSYAYGIQLQNRVLELVKRKSHEELLFSGLLILIEHHPVYTIGIRNKMYTAELETQLTRLGADFVRTNRGGLITFHGPGQMVVYPVLNLKRFQPSVRWYISRLEETAIAACKHFGLAATRSPHTGVWVNNNKICAMGVHASNYITSHGLALNCNTDLKWFSYIVPCGIIGKGATSLSAELGRDISIADALLPFLDSFAECFECSVIKYSEKEAYDILSTIPS